MGNTADQFMDELSKLEERVSRLERWREEMPDGDTMKALGRMVMELASRNDSIMSELEAEVARERMAKLVKEESK